MAGRLPPGEKEKREKFMLEVFLKDPNLSIPKANVQHRAEFKAMMRNRRAYEIRDMARAKIAEKSEKPQEGETSPPAPTGPTANRPGKLEWPKSRVIVVEGDKKKLEGAREIIQALQTRGSAVEIAHEGDAYMVVKA